MGIIKRLKADHDRFRGELSRIQSEIVSVRGLLRVEERREAAVRIAKSLLELVRSVRHHDEIERRVLFPELLAAAPMPTAEFDVIETQHAVIRQTLDRLVEGLRTAAERPPSWMILSMLQLSNMLRRHMAREEALVFPLAYEHLGATRLDRLEREAARMKDPAAARRARL
jgi:hemerythrin-like domain-containing protein